MIRKVQFVGIDNWNRPIFKNIVSKRYYGSTDDLFHSEATEAEVLEHVTNKDLLYFGTSFGCEPMGTHADVIIVRSNK